MFGFKKKRMEFDDLPKTVQDELDSVELIMMEGGDPIDIFEKIAKKYPNFIPAGLNYASFLLDAGEVVKSKSIYKKIIKNYPDEWGAMAGLATVLSNNKEHNEAEKLAIKAIDNNYNWSPCYEVIALAKENRGDDSGAAETYLEGYRVSPHSWQYLEKYCQFNNRTFIAPSEEVPQKITFEQLKSLISSVDIMAHTPDEVGNIPECNHTLRFAEKWAKENEVDIIDLYQFLNSHGGFCDCEIVFNVSNLTDE